MIKNICVLSLLISVIDASDFLKGQVIKELMSPVAVNGLGRIISVEDFNFEEEQKDAPTAFCDKVLELVSPKARERYIKNPSFENYHF